MPSPQTLVETNGRTVRIAVPDNTRQAIRLTVSDSSGDPACKAFATRYVGTPGFTVSTDPGSGPGRKTGERDSIAFHVTLKAVADAGFENPPETIPLKLSRPLGGLQLVPANRVPGSEPARYESEWPVTTVMGKWELSVNGYPSNTVTLKIDKRKQIVEVANSWKGAPEANMDPSQPLGTYHGGTNCNEFVGYVYGYVGLGLADGTVGEMYGQMSGTDDLREGSIAFYHRWGDPAAWQHNAINVGGSIIDQNCNIGVHDDTVDSHSATHPNMVKPNKYDQPIYRSTQELQRLDDE